MTEPAAFTRCRKSHKILENSAGKKNKPKKGGRRKKKHNEELCKRVWRVGVGGINCAKTDCTSQRNKVVFGPQGGILKWNKSHSDDYNYKLLLAQGKVATHCSNKED